MANITFNQTRTPLCNKSHPRNGIFLSEISLWLLVLRLRGFLLKVAGKIEVVVKQTTGRKHLKGGK